MAVDALLLPRAVGRRDVCSSAAKLEFMGDEAESPHFMSVDDSRMQYPYLCVLLSIFWFVRSPPDAIRMHDSDAAPHAAVDDKLVAITIFAPSERAASRGAHVGHPHHRPHQHHPSPRPSHHFLAQVRNRATHDAMAVG